MSTSTKTRAPYHHGDLRRALIDGARELVHFSGVDDISLRQVARQAGVSHAAAYHHFTDKNGLLRAIAVIAFDELTDKLTEALPAAQAEPLDRANAVTPASVDFVEKIALVYFGFAFEHPAEFRFMFRRDLCLPPGEPDPLEVASRRSQAVVTAGLSREIESGRLRAQDAEIATLAFWSLVHGFTTIVLETPAFKSIERADAEALLLVVVRQFVEGAR